MMIRVFGMALPILAVLLCSGGPARAQFDDGVAALQRADYPAALTAWQAAADSGEPRSQYSVGYLYQFGLGVPVDLGKAKDWYEKAAAQNNADALYALGLLYENGKAGRKDLAEAMSYYRRAAETGQQADAEYAVGRMVLRGRGVARDPAEGVKWLKTAAAHNQPAAQYMLGAAYEAGWGVTPDRQEALYWYSRALDGDPVELHEQDMAFEPKIAVDSLRKQLSPEQLRQVEARLRKDRQVAKAAPQPAAKAADKPAATKSTAAAASLDSELPRAALTSQTP